MRIGLVRRGYSASGGAEAYLLRLVAELSAKGHEITLFSDTRWPDEALAGSKPPPTLVCFEDQRQQLGRRKVTPKRFADWLRGQ